LITKTFSPENPNKIEMTLSLEKYDVTTLITENKHEIEQISGDKVRE
jgi:hypothetical protein